MKTTLTLSEATMRRLKQEAARRGKTMSELVEAALRSLLDKADTDVRNLLPLPTFRGGVPRIDVANREALYDVMER